MFTKILYPTDFSKNAEKAFEYVKKLQCTGNAEVVITHIIEKRKFWNIDSYVNKWKHPPKE